MKNLCSKVLHLVIVCALLLSILSVQAFAATFSDMGDAKWDWARSTVDGLVEKGIIRGYEDGTFRPDRSVTNEEALTLFARGMGVNDPINADALALAQAQYASTISKYNTYATKEAAWVLYRGVLTPAELDGYLSEANKANPMKRYEAAVLITKIMGGEKEVSEKFMFVLDYADTADIPAYAKGYVEYVRDKGIMQGMENNTFSPLTDVTRAQICIMLSKVMDSMYLTAEKGEIVSADANNVTVRFEDGSTETYGVQENTKVRILGADSTTAQLTPGTSGIITTAYDGLLWTIDINAVETVSEVKGIFSGTYSDSRGSFIRIYDKDKGVSSTVEYKIGDGAKYTYNGAAAPLTDFKSGDPVVAVLKNNSITSMSGEPKTKTISGATISKIGISPDVTIEISHSDPKYNGKTYSVSSDVFVKRNGALAKLSDVVVGDTVNLTVEYDVITAVDCTSARTTVTGTIEEIVISPTPSIKISTSSGSKTFALSRNGTINIDSGTGTIYDLRLGYNVTVEVQGSTIISISVQSVTSSQQLTGVVKVVNVSYGFITIEVTDTATGTVKDETVFVNSNAAIIDSANPTYRKSLEDITVGSTVTVTGAVKLGAFEATTVIIVTAK